MSDTRAKTGGYAVTTVHSMPWLETPIKQKKVKGQRTRAQPAIVNNIFAQCAELVDDAYWQTTLMQASYGRFPKGFMYKNGIMTFRRGTKTQKIEISDNPIEATQTTINFMKDMAGIRSQSDQERERKEIDEKLLNVKSLDNCTWADIKKKKKIQELLIGQFVDHISSTMNLNRDQKKQLITLINVGFLLGYFSTNSVQFVNGSIRGIVGLTYDQENKEFIFDHSQLIKSKGTKTKVKIVPDSELLKSTNSLTKKQMSFVSFISLWQKFIDSLSRKDITIRTPHHHSSTESTEEDSVSEMLTTEASSSAI